MRAFNLLLIGWMVLLASVPGAQAQTKPGAKGQTDKHQRVESHVVHADFSALTDAEQRVQTLIAGDGVHVVHFWAPWCHNSRHELGTTWPGFAERHPEVSFTFVTVWNDGDPARGVLDGYGLPQQVLALAGPGARVSGSQNPRRQLFLGLPVTWTPTTWIFHRNGQLAYALNYGEASGETLDALIRDIRRAW